MDRVARSSGFPGKVPDFGSFSGFLPVSGFFPDFSGFYATKEIRPDQLWAMLLSIKPTPSPNLHKFISFLFSIPCSNAYVEGVFSIMKHLYDDQRNRMSTELIAAELKIRLNSSLSCTEIYNFLLSKPELLKLIHSNEKYCCNKQRVN